MKKKLFKAMLPTISLLLVAVMSLTGVTYAWFTSGRTATVEAFDVNVKAVDGILISLTGFNGEWGSYIDPNTDAGNGVVSTVKNSKSLRDVSSPGTLVNEKLQFFTAEYKEHEQTLDNIANVTDSVNNNNNDEAHYVYFEFYIKNEGEEKHINLANSVVTGSALSRAACRIAFVQIGTSAADAVLNDGTPPQVTGTPKVLFIWEPNSTQHSPDGVAYLKAHNGFADAETTTAEKVGYKAISKVPVTNSGNFYDTYTGNNYKALTNQPNAPVVAANQYIIGDSGFRALTIDDFYQDVDFQDVTKAQVLQPGETGNELIPFYARSVENNGISYTQLKKNSALVQGNTYYKIKGAFPTVYEIDGNDNILTGTMTTLDENQISNANGLFEVAGKTIVKFGVYVWIEGQDADTTNYVAGNPFSVSIKLNKVGQ